LSLRQLSSEGAYAISTTWAWGTKPISVRTLAAWARAIVGQSIDAFQLKRLRSGVETLLAARGISREVRGQLQSHGLTGVQARYYDGHDSMREKREALDLLLEELQHGDTQSVPANQGRTANLMPALHTVRASARTSRGTRMRKGAVGRQGRQPMPVAWSPN